MPGPERCMLPRLRLGQLSRLGGELELELELEVVSACTVHRDYRFDKPAVKIMFQFTPIVSFLLERGLRFRSPWGLRT